MAMAFLPNPSQPKQQLQQQQRPNHEDEDTDMDVQTNSGTPIRYLPLHHLYSATSPCSGSTNVMSKKIKARKLNSPVKNKPDDMLNFDATACDSDAAESGGDRKSFLSGPPLLYVYSRRRRKRSRNSSEIVSTLSFYDSLVAAKSQEGVVDVKSGIGEEVEGFGRDPPGVEIVSESRIDKLVIQNKKRKSGSCELLKLGVDLSVLRSLDGPRLRDCRNNSVNGGTNGSLVKKKKKLSSVEHNEKLLAAAPGKRWVRLGFEGVDSKTFIGLKCKVYWPMDAEWYTGRVICFDHDTNRHKVLYEDGDQEELVLSNEKIKFYISYEEMQHLHLTIGAKKQDNDPSDYSEMFFLAAVSDDNPNCEPGEIIWAKLTGHTEWPAVIVEESVIESKGVKNGSGGRSIPVQFFGTYDFARIKVDQVVSFLKGLLGSFHLKSRKLRFIQGLEEAKMYLSAQRLPERMLHLQKDVHDENVSAEDEMSTDSGEDGREEGINMKLRKGLPSSKVSSKYTLCKSRRCDDTPFGYRPVRVDWKDLDKCSVCHMDEEYENNLFLQCDKCRMMVHARCYGELEPVNGVLWLCNLCRPGAPESPPRCCLCPVLGGAMKPTTDGRWAHLACAMWIPETCLSDVKRMEPIDGLNRINKDRWKLLCSICGVSYGACIQCSNNTCCVAYHPLCARAAGLCVELEDEDRLYLLSVDDDEDQCIRLLSFCKKHRPPSNDRLALDERVGQLISHCSDYNPPCNPSGCARTEPYNYSCRRGRKEPEAIAAASLKRLFVENQPYVVGGYCQDESSKSSLPGVVGSKFSSSIKSRTSQLDSSESILSIVEKYQYMRETFWKRLAFGKSRIHGFGIFSKLPHRAGDMMIEYTGELVRPSVADRRERFIYNSLVGAGTYMFRIDDERVIDATRAGSIAHLINHSCEPNCYSRVISVNGDEHIIIFAKRDIRQWEELTYDYRFFSIDEQLACYCGFPRCRGIVNDTEAEERATKVYASRSELIDWKGE